MLVPRILAEIRKIITNSFEEVGIPVDFVRMTTDIYGTLLVIVWVEEGISKGVAAPREFKGLPAGEEGIIVCVGVRHIAKLER